MTGVFLSAPRYSWCAPLSHPSSCMLVNPGPSQQSYKKEYKPWQWGATARYCSCASHKKTMLPTRKSVPRSSRQSDHIKTLTIVKRCKLQWYGHVSRSSDLAKTVSQGTVKGGRRQGRRKEVGRQHQGMGRPGVHQVPEGSGEQGKWRKQVVKSSVVPQRPSWLRGRWWWWRWHLCICNHWLCLLVAVCFLTGTTVVTVCSNCLLTCLVRMHGMHG